MTTDEQPADTPRDDVPRSWTAWLALAVPPAATLGWCLTEDRIGVRDSHEGRMWLAGVAVLWVGVWWFLRRRPSTPREKSAWPSARRWLHAVLVASCVYGAFNYFWFDKRVISTAGDYNDVTYYYLNSKYFEELGYYRLYEAMLIADDEGAGRFRRVRQYRDLVGYEKFFPRRDALARADEVKRRFTDERWAGFVHDVTWLTSQNRRAKWDYFFHDHGYNPPPSWTLVGGTFARLCPVEHVKWITMIDFGLVVIAMLCIGWAFGFEALLFSLLWFLVTFSGRWPVLGQSLLRFDWVSALVVAVCMLKKGRHGWAGALLTYSALNRVFPAVFGFPYVVWMVRDAWRRRGRGEPWLTLEHKRFLVGVGISLALFGGGALVTVGPEAFVQSAENLSMHGGPDSYSSHRVGLGDALVYRGETGGPEGGINTKIEMLWSMHTALRVLGVISILLIALYVWRTRREVWSLIWLGIYPLFVMTTPQINYYNLRLLLILLHVGDRGPRRGLHAGMLALLFLIEVVTQGVMVGRASRYVVTTTTSLGLCLYLLLMLVWLVAEVWPRKTTPADGD